MKRLSQCRSAVVAVLLLAMSLSHASCFSNEAGSPFYGRVLSPKLQEFRWSDGGLPQIFDPAFAAAPPDTDLVRAIFEGLTDYDPTTLRPVPAVATRWESSKDGKVWTFFLREDARWSNGELVTADDFIRSWQRTVRLGDQAPHTELLQNIEGASAGINPPVAPARQQRSSNEKARSLPARRQQPFGAEAVGTHVLRVRLERPDLNFPALVAHPVFRPVKVPDDPLKKIEPAKLISNGAFLLSKTEADRVLLERADNYWGRQQVALERVSFVATRNAETALAAYREGQVDAVTNAPFEPLAIKLLSPYQDFRRATYGALTYYSFNTDHAPFDDIRVREALAIAIDRDRISQAEMGGATEPAKRFLPDEMTEHDRPVVGKSDLLEKDGARARELLAEAGYPEGRDFPKIRLLVNRNEQQRIVSGSVAAMWREVLNIETEIVMKSWDEYESAIRAGEYDVVRRGLVMQTTDELTNIRMLFRPTPSSPLAIENENSENANHPPEPAVASEEPIESEEQALRELKAVPIYFASSYSLVKPYVVGF
ncbi:MAG TPA: peptide ABC transporter substrate-binding protein, partial [Pyrinomonadaceae bacterium]|nr:peptide ABC transporter substrate-binding protein [Pyrinomonadaceae bacterium]